MRAFPPIHRWNPRILFAGAGLLALAVLSFRYRGHVFSAFGWLTEATGSRSLAAVALVVALFLMVCAIFWLVFPIIVFFGLRDLRRRTGELEETTRACVNLLKQEAEGRRKLETLSTAEGGKVEVAPGRVRVVKAAEPRASA